MATSSCLLNYRSGLSPILSRDEDSSSNITMKGATNIDNSTSSSSSASSSSNTATHGIVSETLKDVISLQHNAMRRIRTDAERQKLDYVLKVTYDDVSREVGPAGYNMEICLSKICRLADA